MQNKASLKLIVASFKKKDKNQTAQVSINRRIKKYLWYIHAVEYSSTIIREMKTCWYMKQQEGISTILWSVKEGSQRVHTVWFLWYKVLELAQVNYDLKYWKQWLPLGGGHGLTKRGMKQHFDIIEVCVS